MVVTRSVLVGVIGAAMVGLGAFLPWIQATIPLAGSVSRSGLDGGGDGLIMLVLAVAGIVGVLAPDRASVLGTIAGILAVGLAIFEYQSVHARIATPELARYAILGPGIYVAGLGGVLVVVRSALDRKAGTPAETPAA